MLMTIWGIFSFPSRIIDLQEISPGHDLTSYGPQGLGLNWTVWPCREEMPRLPQTGGWLGTLHARETARYEALEQSFKSQV